MLIQIQCNISLYVTLYATYDTCMLILAYNVYVSEINNIIKKVSLTLTGL